jgi:prolyl-tRNA synthetase
MSETDREGLLQHCAAARDTLAQNGIRVHFDARLNVSPGWKFNHWELKGVPLRVEIGPRDMKNAQLTVVRRDTGAKQTVPQASMVHDLKALLETVQQDMFARAKAVRDSRRPVVKSWAEFMTALDAKNLVLAPWCEAKGCEEDIKASSTYMCVADFGFGFLSLAHDDLTAAVIRTIQARMPWVPRVCAFHLNSQSR